MADVADDFAVGLDSTDDNDDNDHPPDAQDLDGSDSGSSARSEPAGVDDWADTDDE